MTPEQFARVQQLFRAGSTRPAAERAAFLARECPDDAEVRTKVERMLAHAERDESGAGAGFLETPALGRGLGAAASQDEIRELAELDRQLSDDFARGGRYRLVARLGEGGFGSVWRAEQLAPVRRLVALKVVKPGMDTRSVLARFEAERQALARLSHPGIATVFDAGVTERGRPWFAMELAEGVPITEYCDRERLDLAARLALFLRVCSAVQHAHQKGILHRDLKPSNVLVLALDGVPVPKVIDFGIAKALGPDGEGESLTAERQFVGTPEYASPEQAAGADVDTRTDVYSLGALLYELACGRTPLDRSRAESKGVLAVLELVRRAEHAPPSGRVAEQGEEALDVARRRGVEPTRLRAMLRGDLDWIATKALERDPARRYATVEALADDVRRHLEDEPVLARAPSAAYRFAKLARRNRGLLTAAALLALALVGGIAGTGAGLVRALRARDAEADAKRSLARTNSELQSANDALARTTAEAEARRKEAESTRDDVLRLSALQDLDDLVAAAATLWPAHPENVNRLERWIDDARALVADLPRHEAQRAELRARALPQAEEERRSERASHPKAPRLAQLDDELARAADALAQASDDGAVARGERLLAELEAERAALERELSERRDWRFPDSEPEARWWNNQLTKLIDGLRALQRGLLADDAVTAEHGWSVPKRLAFARALEERSLSGPDAAARWREATRSIASVEDCPAYGGLALAPQLGLLPIGRDPASGLWEFAHLASGAPAERGEDGRLVVAEETGIVLVLVPGGTYSMGAQGADPAAPNHDPHTDVSETPVHEVELSPFFLAKHEMTLGQWLRATGRNPNQYRPDFYNVDWNRENLPASLAHPVEQVSWRECVETLARLGLALPTEAQWEYAARAGTTSVFWTGDDVASLAGAANLSDAYGKAHGNQGWPTWEPALDDGQSVHARVGGYRANAFGLHDVVGNVMEWCADAWVQDFYARSPRRDPLCPPSSSASRISRGGSYSHVGVYARSAFRSWSTADDALNNQGVRPARAVAGEGGR